MITEFKENIKVQMEVLNALPRNNKKNEKIYITKVMEVLDKYKEIKKITESEIIKRKNRYESLEKNTKIDALTTKINSIKQLLPLINPYGSSYEKSNLDKVLYELGHFYENDLEKVNEDIKKTIQIFETVGVLLDIDDFNYSFYSKKYMTKFLENKTQELKQYFEELYWKCPDIITHITLNFKYLYYQNKKKFDLYYNTKKFELINLKEEYENLYKEKEELIRTSAFLLQQSFLENKLNINDYTIDKVSKAYKSIVSEEKIDLIKNEVIKLYNNVIEYKNYLEFIPIIDNIKELYKEKDKYKNIYLNKKKEIEKLEKKLYKNTKALFKITKERKFEVINSLVNNEIIELKQKYNELEYNYFLEQIMNLDESTTIYDLFNLALSNYNYLMKNEEIDIKKLNSFITNPRINILKNILINDTKDISMLIIDRYNLFGFELKKEQLEQSNLDNLIKELEIILGSIEMEKLGITENRIKFVKETDLLLA